MAPVGAGERFGRYFDFSPVRHSSLALVSCYSCSPCSLSPWPAARCRRQTLRLKRSATRVRCSLLSSNDIFPRSVDWFLYRRTLPSSGSSLVRLIDSSNVTSCVTTCDMPTLLAISQSNAQPLVHFTISDTVPGVGNLQCVYELLNRAISQGGWKDKQDCEEKC